MSQLLLINPRRRRARRKNPSAAQRRARARFAAMARARSANPRRRRRNPAPLSLAAPRRRRRNPLSAARRVMRRRRNPAMLSAGGIMGPIQQAAIMGAGAVAFDVLHAQLARFLPASMQPVPGQIGVGDAVKAVGTVLIARALRGPTRGLSMKAATGALTVQSYGLIKQLMPAGMGLGYGGAATIANMNQRIGPNRAIPGLSRYVPGATQLLNRYDAPGSATPLLNGRSARMREGVVIR